MTITLVVPALDGPVSGGTLFNRAIVRALPEVSAVASVEDAQGFAWVDSLFLAEAAGLWDQRPLGLLAHYLPSLVEKRHALSRRDLQPEERAALQGAQAIVCPSDWMAETVRTLGARGEIRVLEPPLPDGAGVEAYPEGDVRLVMVGAVTQGKGQLSFLRALAESPPRGAWSLDVIGSRDGDQTYARQCEAVATNLPVRWVGVVPPRECLQRTAGAHGLVSASVMESYGMAIAEAQACGVPVLALRGGNAAVLVARPGSVGADDPVDLAAAVAEHVTAPAKLLELARANPRQQAIDGAARARQALAAPDRLRAGARVEADDRVDEV